MKRLLLLIVLLSQLAPTAMGQGASVPCDALERVVTAQRRAVIEIVYTDFMSDTDLNTLINLLWLFPTDRLEVWFDLFLRFSAVSYDFLNNGMRGDDDQWEELITVWEDISFESDNLTEEASDEIAHLVVAQLGSHIIAYQSFREIADLFDAHCPFVNPVQRLFATQTPTSQ